jgi:hypothetical protein
LFFSGSLLALALIKPQMMLLIATYLVLWSFAQWRVRWQFTGGFFLTALLLSASSLLIWPHWVQEWLRVLIAYRRYATPPPALSHNPDSHSASGVLAMDKCSARNRGSSVSFASTVCVYIAHTPDSHRRFNPFRRVRPSGTADVAAT